MTSLLENFDLSFANLLSGVFTGFLYGLLAIGIVLVYRSSRFINFAHVAIGIFAASIFGRLVGAEGLPYWVMFPVGILAGAAIASTVEWGFVRRISDAPRVLGTVVTLALAQFLIFSGLLLNSKNATGRLFPTPPLPSSLTTIKIGNVPVQPSFIAVLILAPIVLVGLAVFLRKSRYGLAIRAAADNPDAASLAGVTSSRMVTLSWALAGGVAAFSVILVYPTLGIPDPEFLGPSLLVYALAGAVFARFQSLPIAFGSSVIIGIVSQILKTNQQQPGLSELALAVAVFAGLLLQPKLSTRRDEDRGEWSKLYPKALPSQIAKLGSVRAITPILSIATILFAVWLFTRINSDTATILVFVVGFTIVGLSVGILTGIAGQLSLGQFAFAAIAGAISVRVTAETEQFFVGLIVGCLVAALASVLVGIPALRLRGLALAVTTLAFSYATVVWLLRQDFLLGSSAAGIRVTPAKLGSFDLSRVTNYYLFSLIFVVLAFIVAANIRRSGFGRVMRALRDNENAARAFTVSANSRKLQTFALSGALAGLGGVVIANSLTTLNTTTFKGSDSVDVVSQTVFGGLGVLPGPLIGAIYDRIPQLAGDQLQALGTFGEFVPALLILISVIVIVTFPRGVGGILVRVRNAFAFQLARWQGVDPVAAQAADDGGAEGQERIITGVEVTPLRSGALGPTLTGADPAGQPAILQVSGVSKAFGGIRAVNGVDMVVRPGEILGIIGPNGAGKTTLFEIIAGFTAPDTGAITFQGRDVTKLKPEARAKLGLVRSFQAARLYPTMTVLETVMVAMERTDPTKLTSAVLGLRGAEKRKEARAMTYLEVMGLSNLRYRPVGELSTGTRRMVEITCMLALDPRVLLLDEPAGGIAQSEGESLVQLLTAVRRDLGTTLVVVEHDLPLLFRLADRVVAMELGAVIAEGDPESVRNHPDVVRSYLGADSVAVERSGPFTAATN
jgi:ABC-type branched-subunit amino acid transport system ATPase component/ABC-type branched-subunit amino acid transport system permease subunit